MECTTCSFEHPQSRPPFGLARGLNRGARRYGCVDKIQRCSHGTLADPVSTIRFGSASNLGPSAAVRPSRTGAPENGPPPHERIRGHRRELRRAGRAERDDERGNGDEHAGDLLDSTRCRAQPSRRPHPAGARRHHDVLHHHRSFLFATPLDRTSPTSPHPPSQSARDSAARMPPSAPSGSPAELGRARSRARRSRARATVNHRPERGAPALYALVSV